MKVFKSQFTGPQIDEGINKSILLDNVITETETVPYQAAPSVEIKAQDSQYLHKFKIPKGPTGPAGDDVFLKLQEIGYLGTREQMYAKLLTLLQPI